MRSVKSYLALEDASFQTRYEYLDGRVLKRADCSLQHVRISVNMMTMLHQSLRDSCWLVFGSDMRVMLNDSRYVYPDISITCSQQPMDAKDLTEPTVIVEVLSPSTEVFDRGRKFEYYRACPSLQAVLLISQDRPAIDVYQRRSADIWTVQTYYLDDDEIVLEAIPATLPVAEVYYDITFGAPSEKTPKPQP